MNLYKSVGNRRQTLIYLDTHLVVWLYAGLTSKLSDRAKHLINEHELYIKMPYGISHNLWKIYEE